MSDIDLIIERFGGLSSMARILNHKHPTTIQGWRDAGKIPSWRIHEIKAAAKAEGIEVPELESSDRSGEKVSAA